MNVFTAVMFYAIAFGHGIEMPPAIVVALQVGYPAWKAGLQPGDRITEHRRPQDHHVRRHPARHRLLVLGRIDVQGVHPDGTTFRDAVDAPHVGRPADDRRAPSLGLEVWKFARSNRAGRPIPDRRPPRPPPSFQPGDRIVGLDNHEVSSFTDLQQLFAQDRAKAVTFHVDRDDSARNNRSASASSRSAFASSA